MFGHRSPRLGCTGLTTTCSSWHPTGTSEHRVSLKSEQRRKECDSFRHRLTTDGVLVVKNMEKKDGGCKHWLEPSLLLLIWILFACYFNGLYTRGTQKMIYWNIYIYIYIYITCQSIYIFSLLMNNHWNKVWGTYPTLPSCPPSMWTSLPCFLVGLNTWWVELSGHVSFVGERGLNGFCRYHLTRSLGPHVCCQGIQWLSSLSRAKSWDQFNAVSKCPRTILCNSLLVSGDFFTPRPKSARGYCNHWRLSVRPQNFVVDRPRGSESTLLSLLQWSEMADLSCWLVNKQIPHWSDQENFRFGL